MYHYSGVKSRVYIDTSFVSYLTARPSRDLIVAAQQQATLEWWQNRRSLFDLHISQLVLHESYQGEKKLAEARLEIMKDFKVL